MEEFRGIPYIRSTLPPVEFPLGRYLPACAPGIFSRWLTENVHPGALVIDPLCASPLLALEAARAGYRVLVTVNNPILALMLEVLASAPTIEEFQPAVTALADLRRGDERLEKHLLNLYQTVCPECGQPVIADAFLWRRDETQPAARILRCASCGAEGEFPIDPADLDHLNLPGSANLHQARARERVGAIITEERDALQDALKAYLPRPLYALFTLINRVEGIHLPPERKRLLQALLLNLCDDASALWSWPVSRAHPRQISIPAQFRENNLWFALENAIESWCGQPGPVPLTHWPDLPPSTGGICLVSGRLRNVLPLPETIHPEAILGIFARPNQAFWTLSAVWSGWIWGRDAVDPMRLALERQHYDWYWYYSAIRSLFSHLTANKIDCPIFGLVPEIVPNHLFGLLMAAGATGLQMQGMALDEQEETVQAIWMPGKSGQSGSPPPLEKICREAIQALLLARGEPASYLQSLSACAVQTADRFIQPGAAIPAEFLTRFQSAMEKTLNDRAFLNREGSASPEGQGCWWLAKSQETQPPLADRVEMDVVKILQKGELLTAAELEREILRLYPGLLTPPADLIAACMESYADSISAMPGAWRLRLAESAAARTNDMNLIRDLLLDLGRRLGYRADGEKPVLWVDEDGETEYAFYLMASSVMGRYLYLSNPVPARQNVLVFPGSRSSLLSYKLKRDARLSRAAADWHLVKYRSLRNLAARPNLTRDLFDNLLDNDPPSWEGAMQMTMFN